ncbi:hypothetical protein KsCSTR_15500 [Candidatus Kuenenia stuttgartiensis]|jgi:predicted DNA-binding antitoxin AbrB/MazE fold protein|uniref:DUF104 domain-containing protein n=1 Tax=Kuenenia stuttgartiensis TaxID=174633 RepID=Q1Q1M0_KUEST|nr:MULTISPECIES: antitoxin family protein [Kuenenia]MBE7548602.1 antitoxin family protein [Planctomycetia bacterium]MBZ0191147.1 antitoxin family protein [Candidatus Kuenenia stuttgartiensis]MCF6152240.1 DUF104 domain-containing protein [Candidatus Kuenenia stuttgartiensis]MCL4726686.1 antitoxin family protein [Candidatus Kuenenia stuttgartiensis]MCZ7621513.1 antitoxin family protein [Candidatus Kuenenia sp.]
MSKTINAIFEDGVFKPLEPVSLNEHERVKLDINLDERLCNQLKTLTETIYKRTDKHSSEEIEIAITEAHREVGKINDSKNSPH